MEVEPEPEVMGHPGHVRDMIARFTQMDPLNTSVLPPRPEIKSNGINSDDDDVTDNASMDRKAIIKDMTLGKPVNNNNDKLWNNEMQADKDSSDNFILEYRKKLKPVAKRVILETTNVDDIISNDTQINNDETPAVIMNGQYDILFHCK